MIREKIEKECRGSQPTTQQQYTILYAVFQTLMVYGINFRLLDVTRYLKLSFP
jgi:hypothetical protein